MEISSKPIASLGGGHRLGCGLNKLDHGQHLIWESNAGVEFASRIDSN